VGAENASLMFVGNATTILEWDGIRLLTDPNFLHAGDHVHLGPGVTAERLKNPAVELENLPRIDVVLLSHYHECVSPTSSLCIHVPACTSIIASRVRRSTEIDIFALFFRILTHHRDHFDRLVEDRLRRSLPIITAPHAKEHLADKKGQGEAFTAVYSLEKFDSMILDIKKNPTPSEARDQRTPAIKITGMPGKHVPPGLTEKVNDALGALPPVNGWIIEFGYLPSSNAEDDAFVCGYRIYISGDTLMIDELKKIPELYTNAGKPINLMLVHLGGTWIAGPNLPLVMVTMDGDMGVQLMQLVRPDVTIPVHMDDYSIMKSGPDDFARAAREAGLEEKVVWLDRGDEYRFRVR
jgi:L-ascorbate metabolism protein UlaG (beta-lactamase superfamily)